MIHKLRIKSVIGKGGLVSIREDWLSITSSSYKFKFFHLYEWYESYINTIEPDDNLVHFFVLYKNDTPSAIFPLKEVKRKILGIYFKSLEIPNHEHMDLSDFIYYGDPDPEFLICLINYLNTMIDLAWDFLVFPHTLAESSTIEIARNNKFSIIEKSGKNDCILCKGYSKKLRKNFRRNLTKARNKLFSNNKVQFYSANTPEELPHSLNNFMDLEASGWKGEKGTGTAIKLNPDLTAFYQALIRTFSVGRRCSINFIKINQKFISGQFCLTVGDTCYILKIGYDENYSKLAPGNLLLEYLLETNAGNKDIIYVDLITGSKWHQDWQPLSQDVLMIYLFKKSILGILSFYFIKFRKLLRLIKSILKQQRVDA